MRLNKFLSEAGVCSRREADRLIEKGRVTVDGKKAAQGMQVTEGCMRREKGHRKQKRQGSTCGQ